MVKIIGINRESTIARTPSLDQAILNLVAKEFEKKGFEVEIKTLKDLKAGETADIILNMARSQEINSILFEKESQGNLTILVMSNKSEMCEVGVTPSRADIVMNMARGEEVNRILFETEKQGAYVVNPPRSVLMISNKKTLHPMLFETGVGTPETSTFNVEKISISDIKQKSVLKAGNTHSVYFIIDTGDEKGLSDALSIYKEKGIGEIVVQKFIDGRFIKFYAVGEKIFLPIDFEKNESQEVVDEIKKQIGIIQKLTGTYIIGGDIIVSEGKPYFTDVNDWPSFSGAEGVKQEDIAPYIADYIEKKYSELKK